MGLSVRRKLSREVVRCSSILVFILYTQATCVAERPACV